MTRKKEPISNNTNDTVKHVEQVLYVGPDEDLTMLRERLAQTRKQSIALVFPAQTQLRSPVAWKLLYKKAQELGKEVAIVSSDNQIRAIARSVHFKVTSLPLAG